MYVTNANNGGILGPTGRETQPAYLAGLGFFFAGGFALCGVGGVVSMRRNISSSLTGTTAFGLVMGGSL